MADDDSASRRPTRTTAATCGELVDIARVDGVRVSRCACGVLHLHVAAAGLTLRFTPERFASLAEAVTAARGALSSKASEDERASSIH